jgi:hypothetical protein
MDQMHAVIARHAEEIRPHVVVGALDPLDKRPVHLGGMRCRIEIGGLDAKYRVAHVVEQVVVGDIAGPEQTYAGFVKTALGELPHQGCGLAGRNEDEDAVGAGVAHALEERREIRIEHGHPQRKDHLAAGSRECLPEIRLGVVAGGKVGDERGHFLQTVLCLPVCNDDNRGGLGKA